MESCEISLVTKAEYTILYIQQEQRQNSDGFTQKMVCSVHHAPTWWLFTFLPATAIDVAKV